MSYPYHNQSALRPSTSIFPAYLDGFPPQDKESLRSLRQETCELVNQDILDLICLLDLYADADTVDARLDQDSLIFVAGDYERVQ